MKGFQIDNQEEKFVKHFNHFFTGRPTTKIMTFLLHFALAHYEIKTMIIKY